MKHAVVFGLVLILAQSLISAPLVFVREDGNDSSNGLSWAEAKATIPAALNIADAGGEVRVSNGTYIVTAPITVATNVWLHSVNGPELTTLDAANATNALIYVNHADATVAGFTFKNVKCGPQRAHAALHLASGTVTNCIIRDNTANTVSPVYVTGGLLIDSVVTNNLVNDYYGAAGLLITGGTVRHCRIVKNTSNNRSSNTAGVQQEGGTVADCFIVGNSGPSMAEGNGNAAAGVRMTGGLLERCVIACNTNTWDGYSAAGGLYVFGSGTVRNCLIAGNRAQRNSTDVAAGLTITASGALVENVTVVDNTNPNSTADGIRIKDGTLRNAIAWNNGADAVDNLNQSGGTVTYSCFPTAVEGDGNHNQAGAPVFRNAAAGDYRLTPEARSCINRGYTASWGPGDKDLAGDKRISGRFCDIGAYEYQYRGTTLVLR